jgi:hypothetical protein
LSQKEFANWVSLAPADFNGDGKQDVASIGGFPPPPDEGQGTEGFVVALGNGNGGLGFNNSPILFLFLSAGHRFFRVISTQTAS